MPKSMYRLVDADVLSRCLGEIYSLPMDGGHEVVIRPYKKQRSLEQNALMWKWYSFIEENTGHRKEDLHEYMKGLWHRVEKIPPEKTTILGREVDVLVSTSRMDVKDMTKFLNLVEALARKLNVKLPPPTFYGYNDINKKG